MSRPLPSVPVKLIIGVFTADRSRVPVVAEALAGRFGRPDMVSPWFAFDETVYYDREMGFPLVRRVFAFERLIDPGRLADIKMATNAMEVAHCDGGKRRVNIDPGYLARSRFVLATGKDFAHRIYLDHGIYADLTLIYAQGGFQRLPWTYPDYGGPMMMNFLEKVRRKYLNDLKTGHPAEEMKP